MECGRRGKAFLFCFLVSALVSQSLVTLAASRSLEEFNDQKQNHVIKPDCDCTDPPHGSGGSSPGHPTPTPSPGGGSSPGHSTPTPSHGGGSSGGHSTPTPPHGGGGSVEPAPSTPTPSHGGGGSGGYYPSPNPTSPTVIPPVTPVHPTPTPTPTPIVVPPLNPTPTPTPIVVPPVNPTPTSPENPTPPSPLIPEPNTPPFFPGTCNYWSTHPGAIWAIFGYLSNIGQSFGEACGTAFGRNLSLPDALNNTRADGIGALYREGTAALLNSLACNTYPFTTQQVKDAFTDAVTSDEAAAHQAQLFKQANEGGLNH